MSLAHIRALRLRGARPVVVSLVVGPVPAWFEDDAASVVVAEDAAPESMDWRAVVGVPLAVFQTKPLPDLTLRACCAAEAAGATFYGAADHTGVYPMVKDPTPAHHLNLARIWRNLCSC